MKPPSVAPTAFWDSAVSGALRRVSVRGWAYDRDDLSKPVTMRFTVSGKVVGAAAEREPPRPVDVGGLQHPQVRERGQHRLDPVR